MQALQHAVAAARGAAAAARPDPHVLLRPDRLPARAHRQRAAVRARRCGCAPGCAQPRLRRDARPQHHRRQRQDLRRGAGRERRARRAGDAVVPRGHRRPRARACPTSLPKATETSRRSSRFIEQLSSAGTRTRSRATSTSASRRDPELRAAVAAAAATRWRSRSRTRSRRTRATSRSGRRTSRARTRRGTRRGGRGRPGWHIECSVMAEERVRPGVRDPRRRARPRLPAPRERARAVARARPRVRAHLDAQRDARRSAARRCRSRSATTSRSATCSTTWGREVAAALLHDRRTGASRSTSPTRRSSRRGRRSERFRERRSRGAERARSATGRRSRRRSTTTSTRRRRSRCSTAGATTSCSLRARSSLFGLGRSPSSRRRRRGRRARRAAARGARREGLRARPTACATRSRPRAGRCATSPDGFRLVRRS